MAAKEITATCVFNDEGKFTIVRLSGMRKITYQFDTSATNADLALRYLVAINGRVMQTDDGKPHVLSAKQRQIVVTVARGSKVELYLNSDVHPDFRRYPVYAVVAEDNDVEVLITEKKGRSETHLKGKLGQPCDCRRNGKTLVDIYKTSLTGDIWTLVSNLYTVADADAMLPADTTPTIRAAVRRIYAGLPSPELVVEFPASDSAPKHTLRVRFEEAQNVRENTAYVSEVRGVLTRTHPRAYAALLAEAGAVGITEMRVTSGWRPMLGSIVHRAGLGLDINYAERDKERVNINRAVLTNTKAKPDKNVSAKERELYAEYEREKAENEVRKKELKSIESELARSHDNDDKARLQERLRVAKSRTDTSDQRLEIAYDSWNKERNKNEASLISVLRGRLHGNEYVKQVLDPWYMDVNTKSGAPPVPNEQRSANEKTHNNHLHITIQEPKIL
ncbi:hypothetical protein [Rugamonas sp. DEMB1]|uniref:hypothetical protein n=1 Tax=Rugamonas sp. DEMB1 TaxID=3039386 RepID=UPI00244D7535|nr:hypothetical protein [Rugamonas sp. DEMB1]WGG52940.1 hypothetical protein QC826_12875 [Rugamonas sp. DEMB1]